MTMVTASTALTIFIMNIHHCGSEARPVPEWAERFILNHLARVCFVYEVGENCLSGSSSKKQALPQEESNAASANGGGPNWDVNGQAWGGTVEGDGPDKPLTDWRKDLFVTVDHSEEEGAAGGGSGGQASSSHSTTSGGVYVEEKTGVGGEGGGIGENLGGTRCVCQNPGLRSDVEYIANSYKDQRAAQLRIGEWRKVAKVMDRFFMWLFFIMVFFMSILILGKAI